MRRRDTGGGLRGLGRRGSEGDRAGGTTSQRPCGPWTACERGKQGAICVSASPGRRAHLAVLPCLIFKLPSSVSPKPPRNISCPVEKAKSQRERRRLLSSPWRAPHSLYLRPLSAGPGNGGGGALPGVESSPTVSGGEGASETGCQMGFFFHCPLTPAW